MTSALDFIISGEGSVYITMTLLALVCTYMQFAPSFAPVRIDSDGITVTLLNRRLRHKKKYNELKHSAISEVNVKRYQNLQLKRICLARESLYQQS